MKTTLGELVIPFAAELLKSGAKNFPEGWFQKCFVFNGWLAGFHHWCVTSGLLNTRVAVLPCQAVPRPAHAFRFRHPLYDHVVLVDSDNMVHDVLENVYEVRSFYKRPEHVSTDLEFVRTWMDEREYLNSFTFAVATGAMLRDPFPVLRRVRNSRVPVELTTLLKLAPTIGEDIR